MAKLYCKPHGDEYSDIASKTPPAGEYVKATFGSLATGPWRCDRCNVLMDTNDEVCLIQFFTDEFPEVLDGYAWQYFSRQSGSRVVYMGDVRPPQAKRLQLSALDILERHSKIKIIELPRPRRE